MALSICVLSVCSGRWVSCFFVIFLFLTPLGNYFELVALFSAIAFFEGEKRKTLALIAVGFMFMKTTMGILSGFNLNADPIIFDFSALLYGLSFSLKGYGKKSYFSLLSLLVVLPLNPLACLIGFFACSFFLSWSDVQKRSRLSLFIGTMLLFSSVIPFFGQVKKNPKILFLGDENLKKHSSVYHIPDHEFDRTFLNAENFLKAGRCDVFKISTLGKNQIFDQVWVVSESLETEKTKKILDWIENGNKGVFVVKPNSWNLILLSNLLPQTELSTAIIFRTDSTRRIFSISSIEFKEGDTVWDIKKSSQFFPVITGSVNSMITELTPLNMTLTNGMISLVPSGQRRYASTPIIHKIDVGKGGLYLFSNPEALSSGRIYGKLSAFFLLLNYIEKGEGVIIGFIVGLFCSYLFFLISTIFSDKCFLFTGLFCILYPTLISISSTKSIIGSPHTASVLTQREDINRIVRHELARSSITVICEQDEWLLFFAKRHFVSKQQEEGVFLSDLESGDVFAFDEKNLPTKADFARTLRSCGDLR
ncbi:hypothetical protein JXA84_01695 [candidate division WOR-3 bacterium]|nr:hypothetical protein [candidate division WOR-3 bacterium]